MVETCEWDRDRGTFIEAGDPGHAPAEYIVGGLLKRRMCGECARLPHFRNKKWKTLDGKLVDKSLLKAERDAELAGKVKKGS